MALVGTRYRPDLAVVCTGNGAFTMGPDDAASAVKLLGVSQAIPVHYAHNPLVVGPQCGDLFKAAVGPRGAADGRDAAPPRHDDGAADHDERPLTLAAPCG